MAPKSSRKAEAKAKKEEVPAEAKNKVPQPTEHSAQDLSGNKETILAKNGKTRALMPMLQKCDFTKNAIQGLVLVPTEDLAFEASWLVKQVGKDMNVQCMVSTDGTNLREDIMRLIHEAHGVHILVATPGRLLGLLRKKVCNLNQCHMVAMDEADKLLCPELQPTIEHLLKFLPEDRQISIYSATFPMTMLDFKNRLMADAQEINLTDELTLNECYAFVEERQKVQCLNTLFSKLEWQQAMIFCESVIRVELLAKRITELGYSCFFIHSHMGQAARGRILHAFRTGQCRCLVSSDVFISGISQSMDVVVNFDFAKSPETYLNRIGHSGCFRISFVTEDERHLVELSAAKAGGNCCRNFEHGWG
eukprot:Skav228903  [mRNA]  locus=scaffold1207:100173:101753:- [translate_table: standard]